MTDDEKYELRERACIIQFGSGREITADEADQKAFVQSVMQRYRQNAKPGSVREAAIRRSPSAKV
jgi:hypothetical protein